MLDVSQHALAQAATGFDSAVLFYLLKLVVSLVQRVAVLEQLERDRRSSWRKPRNGTAAP